MRDSWNFDYSSHKVILKADTNRSGRRRKKKKEKIAITLLNRPRFIVMSIVLTVLVLLFLREARFALANDPHFTIQNIIIENNNKISQSAILKLLGLDKTKTLFGVSSKTLCEKLKNDPDVNKVTIEKKFPHTLKVTVYEHKAYMWFRNKEKEYYGNHNGLILSRKYNKENISLISGIGEVDAIAGKVCENTKVQTALNILRIGENKGWGKFISVKEINIEDTKAIKIKTRERILVIAKESNLSEQVDKLLTVLKDIERKEKIVNKVDLRYKDIYID